MTQVVVLALVWAVALWRAPALVGSSPRRASAVSLLALAGSATMVHRGVREAVDTHSGIADLSILLGHLTGLVMIGSSVAFIADVTDTGHGRPARPRRFEVAVGLVFACLVVLFALMPRRHDNPDFGDWLGGHPLVIAYQVLFQATIALGAVTALSFLVRHSRQARPGPLQVALLLLCGGSGLTVVYVALRFWAIADLSRGGDLIHDPRYAVPTAFVLYGVVATGAVSALVSVAYRATVFLRRQAAYRRLGALWTELTAAVPDAVLVPPPHPLVSLFSVRSAHLLLYRRTVEIRDAQMELSGRVTRAMADAAREALRARGRDDELAYNACALLMALRTPANATATHVSPWWSAAGDIDREAAELVAVADLLRDPAVRAVVDEVLDPAPESLA